MKNYRTNAAYRSFDSLLIVDSLLIIVKVHGFSVAFAIFLSVLVWFSPSVSNLVRFCSIYISTNCLFLSVCD